MRIAGVVLAAGASRRLGTPKQLLKDESGQTFVARTASQLIEAGCDPVLVVTGSAHDDVALAVASLSVEVIFNPEWAEGMAASIRSGVRWLSTEVSGSTIDAGLFTVCDLPSASARHYKAIIDASSMHCIRIASEFLDAQGTLIKGVPALFPREDWEALASIEGDMGARALLAPASVHSVFLPEGGRDIDTPEDLDRWRAELLR